jgi:hypothetical protein
MALALPNFAAVQAFFNNFIAENNIDITGAPHGAFWMNGYDAFVSGPVPNVVDPNTNLPIPILTKGYGQTSNIIYALSGTPGTLWDPNNPEGFGQMPAGGPFFSTAQIQDLSDWISADCPQ